MPSQNQLHFDQALTNVSVRYQNGAYVADNVFPEVPVGKQSNKYFVCSKDNFRADNDRRRPGAVANEVNWSYSSDTYFADGHALRAVVPDEWREHADAPLTLDVDAAEALTDKIMLGKEIDLLAALIAGLTPAAQTAQRWDNNAFDPVKIFDGYKETVAKAIGQKPNCAVLGRPVFRGARNNANVVGRISGASLLKDSLVTVDQLRMVLELDELYVAEATKLTSNEGQTDALDYIWGKYALLYYKPKSPGLRTVSLGYHFMWNQGVMGRQVKRYREENRASDVIEVQQYYDQKIVAAGAGVLFSDCVA